MKKNLFLAFAILLFVGVCFGAFTRTWDETTPTNSTVANQIDDYIRNLRIDLRERMAVDHDNSSDDTDTLGYHDKVTLKVRSEPTKADDTVILYGKDHDAGDGAECMLFIIDEGGNTAQLTVQSAAGDAVYLNGAVLKPLSVAAGAYAAGSVDVDDIANATITVAKMAAAAIVTEAEGVGSVDDDTAVPTDGAVKAYVDAQTPASGSLCKAWVQHASDGTKAGSGYNITSTARNGAGDYTVTWDTNFADTNYAVNITCVQPNSTTGVYASIHTIAAGTVRYVCRTRTDVATDVACHVMAMGTQ